MLPWISFLIRVFGVILTVWQTDQIRTIYANPNLYASAPGGLFGTLSPMVVVIVLGLFLTLHSQKGPAGIVKRIFSWFLNTFTGWIDSDPEFALTVKRYHASVDKAKLLPDPPAK